MIDERVAKGLEPLLEQIEQKEVEVAKLKAAANLYATTLGSDPPFPDFSDAGASPTRRDLIRPDQFAKYSAPSAATRAYLEWRGLEKGAATVDDIYDALHRGGFSFENRNPEDAKSGLRVALGKDGLIHKLTNGYYGLGAWYGRKERAKPVRDQREKKDGDQAPEPTASEEEPAT